MNPDWDDLFLTEVQYWWYMISVMQRHCLCKNADIRISQTLEIWRLLRPEVSGLAVTETILNYSKSAGTQTLATS
jgi:L-lysine 2,3-aminomutase